jgi:hypothetical protein
MDLAASQNASVISHECCCFILPLLVLYRHPKEDYLGISPKYGARLAYKLAHKSVFFDNPQEYGECKKTV